MDPLHNPSDLMFLCRVVSACGIICLLYGAARYRAGKLQGWIDRGKAEKDKEQEANT